MDSGCIIIQKNQLLDQTERKDLKASRRRTRLESDNDSSWSASPPKKDRLRFHTTRARQTKPNSEVVIKTNEMQTFFNLVEDPVIKKFLFMDSCKRVADKYLLAMVFAYFKRGNFRLREFNRRNFFLALYLANDMEEDEEEYKFEIFPWALGYNWKNSYLDFWNRRDRLWKRLSYRGVVSKKACDEIMAVQADHWLWQRERPVHHSGAVRTPPYDEADSEDDAYPRGPDASPRRCTQCDVLHTENASPAHSWYLTPNASDASSTGSSDSYCEAVKVVLTLRKTLAAEENDIWAHQEE